MPAFILPWILSGGWKWLLGGIAALVVGLYVYSWVSHYHHLEAQAAKVPALEAFMAKSKQADADRIKADQALSTWEAAKGDILATIRKSMKNAPIQTNPVCFPTADDRRLRNDAFDKLLPAPAVPAQ